MSENELLEPGKFYHIYNRGNNRENLFREERNYFYFLNLWGKYIFPVAETFAYCLLPNHFHFAVRIRDTSEVFKNLGGVVAPEAEPRILQQFSNLFNAYTKAFNNTYERTGRLFQESFKRKAVTDEEYFSQLIHYIHFNPQRHGLIEDFKNWPYSSYESLISKKPTRLAREEVLGWFGGREQYADFHGKMPTILMPEDFE